MPLLITSPVWGLSLTLRQADLTLEMTEILGQYGELHGLISGMLFGMFMGKKGQRELTTTNIAAPNKNNDFVKGLLESGNFTHKEIKYQSDFPPAVFLQEYDDLIPGSAARLLSMTEAQIEHRNYLQKTGLDQAVARDKRGQVFGLILGLSIVAWAIYCVSIGKPEAATTPVGIMVASLAGCFAIDRFVQQKHK